jgi:hypothetical protein
MHLRRKAPPIWSASQLPLYSCDKEFESQDSQGTPSFEQHQTTATSKTLAWRSSRLRGSKSLALRKDLQRLGACVILALKTNLARKGFDYASSDAVVGAAAVRGKSSGAGARSQYV